MEGIKFLGLLALTWLIVEGAAPIQFIKSVLGVGADTKSKQWGRIVISKLLNCFLCTGFWVGFIYYLCVWHEAFILMACLVSVCAEIFGRLINWLFDSVLNQWKK